MRWATLIALALVAGCNDLRDFHGTWTGDRVGDVEPLRVGPGEHATLTIDAIDVHGLTGRLTVDDLITETAIESVAGAEADVLANMTFSGAPLRVYLAFVPVTDRAGDAFAMIALYDDRRIEVRVLRGGATPLYAIFGLNAGAG